jgi:sulfite reductase alpha subunit-like flavoprotein
MLIRATATVVSLYSLRRKATKSIKHLSLMANSELFSENAPEDYSCRHIEIDLANSGLTYQAGDHLAVYPHNSPSKVERAANRIGINLDRYFSLVPKPGSNGNVA